jgi:hypothetical protein
VPAAAMHPLLQLEVLPRAPEQAQRSL